MSSERVLVTGATGTVGSRVVDRLVDRDVMARAALRHPEGEHDALPDDVETVTFDFERPETWGAAFENVDSVFLLRPPAISRVHQSITPAIEAAERVGVEHVVVLSVLGVQKNPLLPHRRIEKHVLGTDLDWTFVLVMAGLYTTARLGLAGRGRRRRRATARPAAEIVRRVGRDQRPSVRSRRNQYMIEHSFNTMELTVFGASGRTSVPLVELALDARHQVTAFVRDESRLPVANESLAVGGGDTYL